MPAFSCHIFLILQLVSHQNEMGLLLLLIMGEGLWGVWTTIDSHTQSGTHSRERFLSQKHLKEIIIVLQKEIPCNCYKEMICY